MHTVAIEVPTETQPLTLRHFPAFPVSSVNLATVIDKSPSN